MSEPSSRLRAGSWTLTLLWLLLAALFASHVGGAQAGQLKISTVQLRLTDSQPRSSLTLTNAGALPTLVHVRVQRWSQTDGKDHFEPAPEIVVNPPIIQIKPEGRQLVRVGYNGPKGASASEGAYRMFIEEVPMNNREQVQAIETYLHINLPVFVGDARGSLKDYALTLVDGPQGPQLRVANSGAAHLRMIAYKLTAQGKDIGFENKRLQYVLPGSEVALPVLFDNDSRERADSLTITTDDGPIQLPIRRIANAR
ncbi:MAG TPA: fimbria/pilus periplasmic chaperone [Alphaproteobacteria bacterium]|nr:fimbria/pilus periplasmic chaperone [Alphaproteobacteria bacterium]